MIRSILTLGAFLSSFNNILASDIEGEQTQLIKADVVALSEPLVDIIYVLTDDQFAAVVATFGKCEGDSVIERGGYKQISRDVSDKMISHLATMSVPPSKVSPGSAAANSMAGIASFGGNCSFAGLLTADVYGQEFLKGLNDIGVTSKCKVLDGQSTQDVTGRSIILVTGEGQRTIFTYIGAGEPITSTQFSVADFLLYQVFFSEVFLLQYPETEKTLALLYPELRKQGLETALGLANEYVIRKVRKPLTALLDHVDIVFGNAAEYMSLLERENIDGVFHFLHGKKGTYIITMGDEGAYIVNGDHITKIPPSDAEKVVDTTGAGDAFAAGFLYGHTHGLSLENSGRLGSRLAAHVIQSLGARPEGRMDAILNDLLEEIGTESAASSSEGNPEDEELLPIDD